MGEVVMYKVLKTQLRYYPHALLLLADMTTGERRWWCFGRQHEEDLCEDYHTKDLAGAVLVDFIDQRLLLTLFRMGRRQMGEGIYQSFCNFADEKENSLHNFKNLK